MTLKSVIMNTPRKQLNSAGKEIIANVIRVCREEAINGALNIPLSDASGRASMYTGYSYSTIKKIKKEDMEREDPSRPLLSPKRKRSRSSISQRIDDADFQIIRQTISNFYTQWKVVPTLRKLIVKLKQVMDFTYSRESLRLLLKQRGFYFKKCQNKRKILMERPHIIHLRYKYLKRIRQFREEKRHIIYIDETWVDNDITFKKCWQSDEISGIISNISSTGRLIVVHAGSENGFVKDAGLIFKAGMATGDYHGQMNQENFTKWLTEKLLPNIPPHSVIVLDNAPYHSVLEEKVPTKSSLKRTMIEWLVKHNIPHDTNSRKSDLWELVNLHKPPADQKIYKIDKLISSYGHDVLRTPPYMCELNPIELAWSQIKYYIRSKNTTGEFSIKKLTELTEEAMLHVGADLWKGFMKHVVNIENKYWETDKYMEEITERIIIRLGETDSDDSEDSEDEISDVDITID